MTPHGSLSGQTLSGKYLLGMGGFGAVYRAENQFLQRTQAVKVLREELLSEIKFRERFLREARTLGTQFPLPQDGQPYGITAGPDGNLWLLRP